MLARSDVTRIADGPHPLAASGDSAKSSQARPQGRRYYRHDRSSWNSGIEVVDLDCPENFP